MATDPFEFIDRQCGRGQIPSALEQELFRLAPSINHSSCSNNNVPGSAEEDPKATTSRIHEKKSKKKKEASSSSSSRRRRRLRGAQLRTSISNSSSSDADAGSASAAAPSTRTLPATILNPNANPHAVLTTLEQVVRRCSRVPDMPLDDADLLDVGETMGIHFDPPSWWRPGGYN